MREARQTQPSLTESWLDLGHAKELEAISRLLDQHPRISERIAQDLRTSKRRTGARGLSADQVLRALLVKQMNGFSYRQLAFHLADSRTYRTFCRLGPAERAPSKSTLAGAIKSLEPETFEQIHRWLLDAASARGIETGQRVRVDSTFVESTIHEPSDSSLLWDGVRVLTRLMRQTCDLLGPDVVRFHDRTRRAKRRDREIFHAKRRRARRRAYQDLLRVTEEVLAMAQRVHDELSVHVRTLAPAPARRAQALLRCFEAFLAVVPSVVEQTRSRVLDDQPVPARDKVVSLFEPHTDVLRKSWRQTFYGHKICLTGGASSMILDCVILEGNPPDQTLAQTMIDRQVELFDRPPREAVFDGGFATVDNLTQLKQTGVQEVAFAKKAGLKIEDMVRSLWVYRRLRDFRSGIEGVISFLKRCFGLTRCTWRSLASFRSYVWSSILSYNLLVLARHQLA